MDLSFAAATDVGRARPHNEDNFLVDRRLRLFIVCDGMGGHAAGEVASSIAVHAIRDAVEAQRAVLEAYRPDRDEPSTAQVLKILEHAITDACAKVFAAAEATPAHRGMGTTASVLLIAGAGDQLRGFIGHVGDSRIYLGRKGQSHQLTEDHSLLNELVRRGKLTRAEVEQSAYRGYKNAVTRAVGVYATVEVDTIDLAILPEDQFLICSDGLYAYLDDTTLDPQLRDGDVREVPRRLIEVANQGGGHDNITGIVVRVGGERRAADDELALALHVLRDQPMFRYLSYKELMVVAAVIVLQPLAADEVLITPGHAADAMYIVMSGALELRRTGHAPTPLAAPHSLGEPAVLEPYVHTHTVLAREASRVLRLSRDAFVDLLRREPGIAVKVLWNLAGAMAGRLRTLAAAAPTVSRGADDLFDPGA